jgi:hypothetical protein
MYYRRVGWQTTLPERRVSMPTMVLPPQILCKALKVWT